MIGDYKFTYPSWWSEVSICFPDSLVDQNKMDEYLNNLYGSDVGDSTNWKEVMKHWYMYVKTNDIFPVYFGHCFAAIGKLNKAIQVYEDLYEIVPDDSLADWYQCYLSYSIGKLYAKQHLREEALNWFEKASDIKFIKSSDQAISYYAKEAKDWIEKNKN